MYPSNREDLGAGYLGGPFGQPPASTKPPVRRVSYLKDYLNCLWRRQSDFTFLYYLHDEAKLDFF